MESYSGCPRYFLLNSQRSSMSQEDKIWDRNGIGVPVGAGTVVVTEPTAGSGSDQLGAGNGIKEMACEGGIMTDAGRVCG